jgi:GNAT superfamily N-acetyltransferase
MHLRRLRADDGLLIRHVRLRALTDAPYAFGPHAFEEESALPDSHWHELAAQVGGRDAVWGDRCAGFVADDAGYAWATVTCFLCPRVPRRAYLTALWVDPRHRRAGLGRRLVEAVSAWAAARGADHLRLWLDDTNPAAACFYRALGFTPTGESQPITAASSDLQCAYQRPLNVG